MAVLYTEHFVQFFDDNGDPLSGGKLYAYSAGTTTPKATYTTEEATVQHAHPIVLDAAGRATVFIEGSYRFDLYDADDVLIKSTDDVTSFTTLAASSDPFFQSFSGTGSQTVFTLSEPLGSDSKGIMVFVDAGGSKGFDVINPSAYTLAGTALTFNTAPASGTNNIYVFSPSQLLGAASAAASAAAASEAAAATSATSAATSATSAGNSATSAAASATTAAGILDDFDDIYLGAKSSDPTLDNDGDPLAAGQLYYNTVDDVMKVYSGTAWLAAYVSGSGFLASANNLSDLTNASTARTNLGLGNLAVLNNSSNIEFTGLIDVVNVNAHTTAGGDLRTSTGVSCLSWGAGGSPNATLGGNMSGASTHKLVSMADPTSAQDYATKIYVDTVPGLVRQHIDATYGLYTTTTANIPLDDTIPQNTEGFLIISQAITPLAADSIIEVSGAINAIGGTQTMAIVSVFDSAVSATDAVAVFMGGTASATHMQAIPIMYRVIAGSTSARTISVRFGTNTGTGYINGNNSSRLFGGASVSRVAIREILA